MLDLRVQAAGVVAGALRVEVEALDEQDVGAGASQMAGGRRPGDAAADDEDVADQDPGMLA